MLQACCVMSYQMSMAAVYWKHDRSSSGALYHLVTTYSVMKLRSELQAITDALTGWIRKDCSHSAIVAAPCASPYNKMCRHC